MAMSARNESLEAEYPNLASSDYRITSPRTPESDIPHFQLAHWIFRTKA